MIGNSFLVCLLECQNKVNLSWEKKYFVKIVSINDFTNKY